MFHSTPVAMRDDKRKYRRRWRWALPASLVLHLLVVGLVVFAMPLSLPQPEEKEEAISVELVPPPSQTPPPPGDDARRHGAPPVVEPVFQFGEKDAGPR
jgi:hypothetical protein